MEVALKQRLVGASVIIALAVIFIPMLFDNKGIDQNQSITIDIPDEPENLKQKVIDIDTGKFTNNSLDNNTIDDEKNINNDDYESSDNDETQVINQKETILDVVDNSKDLMSNDSEPTDENDTSNQENENIVNNVDEVSKSEDLKPMSKESEKPNTQENQDLLFYRVKYGVFSQQKNAQQLKAKIINSGYKAIVEKNNDGELYTVYSQQLTSESSAISIRDSIQKLDLNIGKPSIITLNEEESLTAEQMLDTGWILQIGSFSSKTNSIKLRDKIRSKGFVTFVDEITDSKNQKRYRVRIGPYATRDEAKTEKNNIKKSMDLDGIIKPHEKQKVITQ